jgi:hypothetical protein
LSFKHFISKKAQSPALPQNGEGSLGNENYPRYILKSNLTKLAGCEVPHLGGFRGPLFRRDFNCGGWQTFGSCGQFNDARLITRLNNG